MHDERAKYAEAIDREGIEARYVKEKLARDL